MTTCFICLDSTKNKVCFRCLCFAHPNCWHKYLEKSIVCPICKTQNIFNKYRTRSKTNPSKFLNIQKLNEFTHIINNMTSHDCLVKMVADMIKDIKGSFDKIKKATDLFYLLYASMLNGGEYDIINKSENFKEAVSIKLIEFSKQWDDAKNWYLLFFPQIPN